MDTQNKSSISLFIDSKATEGEKQAVIDAVGQDFSIARQSSIILNSTSVDNQRYLVIRIAASASDLPSLDDAKAKLKAVSERLASDARIGCAVYISLEFDNHLIGAAITSDKNITIEEKTLPKLDGKISYIQNGELKMIDADANPVDVLDKIRSNQ